MNDICYPQTGKLLSAEEARARICQATKTIQASEIIPLAQALGRVVAKTLCSPIDIPPQRNAAMDGYAFASTDLREQEVFSLENVGISWAGKPFSGEAGAGCCVRIFTGAVVPDFADSVIAQELVTVKGNRILFPPNTQAGKNIRAAGSDVKQQEPLITQGKKLTASDLGLLAAAGVAMLEVYRPLRIAYFSTGDELTPVGQALQSGQIYDSNRYLLNGLLNDPAHLVTDLGVIRDDPTLLEQALRDAAANFDVLISTGGASVGDADFVKQTLEKCGVVNFWKLAIKPGKPLAFGNIGACWFFGLPGNPAAVLVTYAQLVKPALRQLTGQPAGQPLHIMARCDSTLHKSPGRQEYQRGILKQLAPGEFSVIAAGAQESHQLKVASLANCFIVLDRDCAGVSPGQRVMVEPFDTEL